MATKRAQRHAAALKLCEDLVATGAWRLHTDWSLLLKFIGRAEEIVDPQAARESEALRRVLTGGVP